MKKFFFEMNDDELEKIDLVQFTGLKVGDRVVHANSSQQGTVIDHQNNGLYSWGGLCVTVTVKWDDGNTYSLDYLLAKKVA